MSDKIFSCLVSIVVCVLVLTGGCTTQVVETATLALKFTEQDSTSYRMVTQSKQILEYVWDGPEPQAASLKGGQNENKIEIVFNQQVQSIDDKNNAVMKITIEGIKYLAVNKGNVAMDFDSSREADKDNPLAKLIGQSYRIRITATGRVLAVTDTKEARTMVKGRTSANKAALKLLASEIIRRRHTIPGLPAINNDQLAEGDTWSSINTISFPVIGSKSYERIYSITQIKEANGHRRAIVEMEAIPSSEMAEQLHKGREVSSLLDMFDSTEMYTGEMQLDLTTGKIVKYSEKLDAEWVVVNPSGQENSKEPAALRMGAVRFYSIEKID